MGTCGPFGGHFPSFWASLGLAPGCRGRGYPVSAKGEKANWDPKSGAKRGGRGVGPGGPGGSPGGGSPGGVRGGPPGGPQGGVSGRNSI